MGNYVSFSCKEAGIPRAGWETKGLNFKSSTGSPCSHLPALQHHLQRCCQNHTHCKPREAGQTNLAQWLTCSGNCEFDSPKTWNPSAAKYRQEDDQFSQEPPKSRAENAPLAMTEVTQTLCCFFSPETFLQKNFSGREVFHLQKDGGIFQGKMHFTVH